jgi:drug/metabolite transporter (DMT)-like permease
VGPESTSNWIRWRGQRQYQIANVSVIAPFDYSYLPLAAILGYLLRGEIPLSTTFIGMVLIVSSGVYTAYRELRIEGGADYHTGSAKTKLD